MSPNPQAACPEIPARSSTVGEEPVTVRLSSRARSYPDNYGWSSHLITEEPDSAKEVMKTHQWLKAMQTKMESLKEHEVWELTELPEGLEPVGSKWVFKTKVNADCKIEYYKAWLVAQGFSQRFGSDYDETFSPVVRLESVCTLIGLSVHY